ncbi:MAG: M50 family metallopeptidase [Oscillospiraceae bacterium]|nr:M50 family metallopeptidase [Oscillospiraceae bacterium]
MWITTERGKPINILTTILSILVGILFFGVVILVHELGHFWAARANNVKVIEFSVGMGPRLLKKQRGETLFSLKAIPFGGSCQMQEDDGPSDDPRAFVNKKSWRRFTVLAAGAMMNLLLGVIMMGVVVAASPIVPTTTVGYFHRDAITHEQGLYTGDVITHVNGRRVYSHLDIQFLYIRGDRSTVDLVVRREGQRIDLPGIELAQLPLADGSENYHLGFWQAPAPRSVGRVLANTFTESASMTRIVWLSLFDLITGQFGLNDVAGPVGLVVMVGDGAQNVQEGIAQGQSVMQALSPLLFLGALISINIGIMNLLPLPALDGGRIVFVLIEAIARKPVPKKFEGMVHGIGLALLMLLMIIITFSDIIGLFRR